MLSPWPHSDDQRLRCAPSKISQSQVWIPRFLQAFSSTWRFDSKMNQYLINRSITPCNLFTLYSWVASGCVEAGLAAVCFLGDFCFICSSSFSPWMCLSISSSACGIATVIIMYELNGLDQGRKLIKWWAEIFILT